MSLETVAGLYPLKQEAYKPYLRKGVNPPLDTQRIKTEFLLGNQRNDRLTTPFNGDGSLVMSYLRDNRTFEGLVISFQKKDKDLLILQIQGARSRAAYRLSTGLDIESFAADQIKRISCMLSRFQLIDRIAFPIWITGIENAASENVGERYRIIGSLLGMELSSNEKLIVGKAKNLNGNCKNPCPVCP